MNHDVDVSLQTF